MVGIKTPFDRRVFLLSSSAGRICYLRHVAVRGWRAPQSNQEMDMPFDAHVLKLLVASPSDTGRERDAIEQAVHA